MKRNVIIHFYFGVDREAVWLAVKERMPAIKLQMDGILQDLESK